MSLLVDRGHAACSRWGVAGGEDCQQAYSPIYLRKSSTIIYGMLCVCRHLPLLVGGGQPGAGGGVAGGRGQEASTFSPIFQEKILYYSRNVVCRHLPLFVGGGQPGADGGVAGGREQGAVHQVTLHLRDPTLSARQGEGNRTCSIADNVNHTQILNY